MQYQIGTKLTRNQLSKMTVIGGKAEFVAYEHPTLGDEADGLIVAPNGVIVEIEASDCFDDYEDEDIQLLRARV